MKKPRGIVRELRQIVPKPRSNRELAIYQAGYTEGFAKGRETGFREGVTRGQIDSANKERAQEKQVDLKMQEAIARFADASAHAISFMCRSLGGGRGM